VAIVFVILGALVVFLIAAVVIGRETGRLAAAPPRPVFDVDEAVVWIADRLPPDVTARRSHAEVRRLLLWSVEHLRELAGQERVADEEETFGYVVDRAAETGLDWEPLEVKWVLDLQAEYLEIIGATGRAEFSDTEMPPETGS
jgi:hypothetical protein